MSNPLALRYDLKDLKHPVFIEKGVFTNSININPDGRLSARADTWYGQVVLDEEGKPLADGLYWQGKHWPIFALKVTRLHIKSANVRGTGLIKTNRYFFALTTPEGEVVPGIPNGPCQFSGWGAHSLTGWGEKFAANYQTVEVENFERDYFWSEGEEHHWRTGQNDPSLPGWGFSFDGDMLRK